MQSGEGEKRHWRVRDSDGGVLVHAEYWQGQDIALCGLSLDGDDGSGNTEVERTNRRITCPDCAKAIQHAKAIRQTAISPVVRRAALKESQNG